jgi:hypothetical protein
MDFNMDNPPDDAVTRLAWLADRRSTFMALIEQEFQQTYFEARLTGRLDAAVSLGLHSRNSILKRTRNENEARGRMMRWGDNADKTSSAFKG